MFKKEGDFERLCFELNYQFHDKELLAQAITTKSAWVSNLQKASIGHHLEMAFFGDGILRMVVDKILMEKFPYYNVDELSKARDLIVKNINLIEAAKRLALEQFIIMDVNQVKQCQQGTPKLLADTMEAIIYAIYKDSKENLQEVEKFIFLNSSIDQALEQQRFEKEKLYKPLIYAIQDGEAEQVQEMLMQGFPPNFIFSIETYGGYSTHDESMYQHPKYLEPVMDEEKLTPLECALDVLDTDPTNMLRIIECLLKHGANPNLHVKENTSLIRQLFSSSDFIDNRAYCFVNYTDFKNKQALEQYLVTYRDKLLERKSTSEQEKIIDQVVEMFCRFGVKLNEENYIQDNTLLQLVIILGDQYKIDLLLKYKINFNIQNKRGETALHLAALFGDKALAVKLLDAGANPTIPDKNGLNPFDVARTPELKKLLLEAEIKNAPVLNNKEINIEEIKQTAMSHYKEWEAQKLLDELIKAIQLFTLILKHKLNNKNIHDISLIYDFYNLGSAYFQRRSYEKAKPLLDRAYILYLINEQQFQAKTDKYFKRLSECEKLIEQNKSENAASTVSHIVESSESQPQHKSVVIPPVDNQLQLGNIDQELFASMSYHNVSLVKKLLSNGANPEAVSEEEGPALHHAIRQYARAVWGIKAMTEPYCVPGLVRNKKDALQIVEMLMIYGADPNQGDAKGRTALHVAAIAMIADGIDTDISLLIGLLLRHGADPTIKDHDNNFASHYAKESSIRRFILHALIPAQPTSELIAEKASTQKKSVNEKGKAYKTALCKFFKAGNPNSCNKGEQCNFAHDAAELKH